MYKGFQIGFLEKNLYQKIAAGMLISDLNCGPFRKKYTVADHGHRHICHRLNHHHDTDPLNSRIVDNEKPHADIGKKNHVCDLLEWLVIVFDRVNQDKRRNRKA